MAITIVMGKPGAGKSTYLAYRARKAMKKKKPVWSNVYLKGTYQLDIRNDLNKYMIQNGLVIIDEAGYEFNARDFKKFTTDLYRFYTMHRHYGLDIILAVQFWDRLDIVIRELVQTILVVRPTMWNRLFIKTSEIGCSIDISEDETIVERFYWKGILVGGLNYYWRVPLMKMFDSYYVDPLPLKDFSYWRESEEEKKERKFWSMSNILKTLNKPLRKGVKDEYKEQSRDYQEENEES